MVVMSRSTGRKYPSFATKMRCIATVNSWKVKWPSPSMSDNFLQRSKKNLDFSTFDTSDSFGSPSPPTPCGLGMRLDSIILALVGGHNVLASFPGSLGMWLQTWWPFLHVVHNEIKRSSFRTVSYATHHIWKSWPFERLDFMKRYRAASPENITKILWKK